MTTADAAIVTVVIDRIPAKLLPDFDLKTAHKRLRSRLVRAGFRFAIGGFEVEFREKANAFDLHAHLVMQSVGVAAMKALRRASKSVGPRAVKKQALRNQTKQFSYLLKFVTYHRPLGPKTKAVPLPKHAHRALLEWRARYNPRRFIFLFGARFAHSHIVRSG